MPTRGTWTHGTTTGYSKHGCRCDDCKQAKASYRRSRRQQDAEHNRDYQASWRQKHPEYKAKWWDKRKAKAVESHGATGYAYGCRCNVCATGRKEQQLKRRLAKPPQEVPHSTENGYANYACRCRGCTDAHNLKTGKHQAKTIAGAHNHGNLWTGPELETVVTRTDLTLNQLAQMLGRTRWAVDAARRRATTDPKWVSVVGLRRVDD